MKRRVKIQAIIDEISAPSVPKGERKPGAFKNSCIESPIICGGLSGGEAQLQRHPILNRGPQKARFLRWKCPHAPGDRLSNKPSIHRFHLTAARTVFRSTSVTP